MEHTENIKIRAVKGLRWTAGMTIFSAIVGPLLQVVKARFMLASELAAVAIVMLIYGFLQVIENAGMQETLIQKKELSSAEKNTLFLLSVVLGLTGAVVMFFTAKFIEKISNVPGSAHLIVIASPLFFFAQINQTFRSLLHRDLIYKGPSIVEMTQRVLHLLFLILFFKLNLGALSVVYAMLSSTIISTAGLSVLVFRNVLLKIRKKTDLKVISYFIAFGVPIALKRIFTYFTRRADELFIAITLSPETLGYYHLAKETLEKLTTLVTSSFSKILLPLFSRVNEKRKVEAYKNITLAVSYIGIPIFVGVFLTANNLVPAVFGSNWSAAVFSFQILSIAAIPTVLTANLATSLLYSEGKSKSVLVLDIIINCSYLFIIHRYSYLGPNIILFSYCCYSFLKATALQVLVNKSLKITAAEHVRLYLRVSLRVLFMASAIILVRDSFLTLDNHIANSTLLILTGVVVMPLTTFFTDRKAINLFKSITK